MLIIDKKILKLSSITLALFSYSGFIQAEIEKMTELETISVSAQQQLENIRNKKVAETVKTSELLKRQQVQDTRDLVRYETGVTVVETGRFGASGYAIRGVDENRVAITIDGLHQAEALSSQGFKELFEGYGNFNNRRNGVEIETLKQVKINKGANSVKVGSGALGGSVMFETKDARDFLLDKDSFYSIKGGLSSADEQAFHSHTFAGRYKYFDLLAIYTHRNQHELQNFGYDNYDRNIFGKEREKADPYHIQKESTLIKIGFQPNEENRLSFTFDGYTNESKGHDYSYTLTPKAISQYGQDNFVDIVGQRYTHDISTRKNFAFTFENFTQTPFWDSVKVTYSNQKIKNRARTEEYCRGDKCQDVSNPLGLKISGAKVVDKYAKEFDIIGTSRGTKLQDSNEELHNTGYDSKSVNEYLFDCSVYDCSGSVTAYYEPKAINSKHLDIDNLLYIKKEIDLTKDKISFDVDKDGFDNNYNWITERQTHNLYVENKEYRGKKYKKIIAKNEFYSSYLGKNVETETNDIKIIVPGAKGYLERDWKERDLDTDTKQVNLDFQKYLQIKHTEHSLSYGGMYKETEKRMVNRQGYDATNPQWWADTYVKDCAEYGDAGNALKCPRVEEETSFLIPVKSKEGALYIANEIRFSDKVGFDLGYRYDRIKYKPNYITGVSPKIPDGMVEGLFIPLNQIDKYAPSPYRAEYNYDSNNPLYQKVLAEWKAKKEENDTNADRNITYFSQPKKFTHSSYAFGLNLDPSDYLRIQAKYSKGFRAPTHEELYFTFKHPDFTIKPNVDLKPEIAKTQEIAFTFHKNNSFITISGFRSDYKDFLDLQYLGVQRLSITSKSALDFDIYQNVNRQKASVKGFEINSLLSLGDISDRLSGFTLGWKFTKQKSKVFTDKDGYVSMNAIQPTTSIYSIGYASPDDKYGADIYVKQVSSKKAKDTYNMFWRNEQQLGDPINGKTVDDSSAHWLSNRYTTLDFIGYYRPIKNLTLRFGAYNITNQKYITWDSARSIRSFGTTNRVNKSDSLGINRFNAPGRNFRLSVEYIF
ncbi:hemoglobin/transferrin/lactoferrin receptor protein [Bisgaardia hudsonensis]|uniref:Hemoglobin/transferrin/lactoferrin receptor protein n=1 Tax=Bisgaardia hudsonensis TaxID=109472 RepID=A0A4R2MXR8_9PAST|nr:TonB-dependent hemoglobin/transferrin/lactoferrin family receptor [Bisgaardia hudsonensis]QLB12221.1 hypothetical protein A6A11_00615 [Bisgaardia hudsonensis]TCP12264.1 hemoglobin/transferrin/lactoferrin receptor protein [Bisgaardia hudsonensis]